jgi:hypothetical protein
MISASESSQMMPPVGVAIAAARACAQAPSSSERKSRYLTLDRRLLCSIAWTLWDVKRKVQVVTYLDMPKRSAESTSPELPPAPAPASEGDVALVEKKPIKGRPHSRKLAAAGLRERARTFVREQLMHRPKQRAAYQRDR